MAFYTLTRFRLFVILLISLIIWQLFSLLSEAPANHEAVVVTATQGSKWTQDSIEVLEDDRFNKHKKDKVKVRVYYETLCPDSKHFFMSHLLPVTEKLSDFLTVTLVPYGKATTTQKDGQFEFKCQHGPEECNGNKIHACSVETIQNDTLSVQFTACMIADNMDSLAALTRCGDQYKIDTAPISNCALSIQGSKLLSKHGEDTNRISPSFIPTISVNGDLSKQEAMLKNFLLEVCKLIDMPLPPPCL